LVDQRLGDQVGDPATPRIARGSISAAARCGLPAVPVIWSPPPEPPQPKTSVKDTNDARHSRFVLASFT
jgi:hypothetical protein